MPREPLAHIVLDPDDYAEHAEALNQIALGAPRRLVCHITPGPRTLHGLAAAVLAAMGKDGDLTGTSMTANENWRRAFLWAAGSEVDDIVIDRAHLLSRVRWQQLAELAAFAGARLWLLVQGTTLTRGQSEFARDWDVPRVPFKDFSRELSGDPIRTQARPRPPFPAVTDDEFPTFLASCRSTLSAADMTYVEDAYWNTFEDFRDLPNRAPDPTDIATSLRRLCDKASDLFEVTTRLRAAQAALFLHGVLVNVDSESLAAGYTSAAITSLTGAAVRRLDTFSNPRSAALGVIAMLTLDPPPRLARLDLGSIAADSSTVTTTDRELHVPEFARSILASYRLYRRWEGARYDDPLFVSEGREPRGELKRTTAHGLQQRLRSISLETGLITTSRESWAQANPKRWIKNRGITVRPIGEVA